eukprot:1887134-Rhodomonas_salina.1
MYMYPNGDGEGPPIRAMLGIEEPRTTVIHRKERTQTRSGPPGRNPRGETRTASHSSLHRDLRSVRISRLVLLLVVVDQYPGTGSTRVRCGNRRGYCVPSCDGRLSF